MSESNLFWALALKRIPGVGAITARKLIDRFGGAEEVFSAADESLDEVLNTNVFAEMRKYDPRKDDWINNEIERIEKAKAHAYTILDDDYPENLRVIPDAPVIIYVIGEIIKQDELAIGIVGTRRPSRYGVEQSRKFADYLVRQGVTIVSGMASGVDGNAQDAAIRAGGRTIAVLGCGADIVFPSSNRQLYDQIKENGAIVSEYALGTHPEPAFFPPRNRIISGLSKAVLVIEGGGKSGALITAKAAASQGRDVYALPGQVDRPTSEGPNQLIRDGAIPALKPSDLLTSLKIDALEEDSRKEIKNWADKLDGLAKTVYSAIEFEGTTVDFISAKTNMEIPAILAILTELEMKDIVKRIPGSKYSKNV